MSNRNLFAIAALLALSIVYVFDPIAVSALFGHITPTLGIAAAAMFGDTAVLDAKALEEQLKKIGDQVKDIGEKAMAEARKSGDMSAATKASVDKLLVDQGALQQKHLELQARLSEVEKKDARIQGDEASGEHKSLGAQFVESENYKSFMAAGGMVTAQHSCRVSFNAAVTSTDTTNTTTVGVPPDVRPGIILLPQRRLRIRDLITPGTTSSNLVEYVRQTGFTNNAAIVSEGVKKPESTITNELVQAAVRTIAHYMKASRQILADFAGLQSMIDGMLRTGLKVVEENQLLKGSGVGQNLNGIYTQATAYAAPIVIASPTKIDTMRLMILQVQLAGEDQFDANGIVLHPSDWAAIELTKETTGGYIFANPQGMVGPMLWSRPVVPTTAMTVDTALVGDFTQAQVFDREEINVVIATQNEDDFVKNMITLRCEERLTMAVYRPEAFVKNTNLPST